MEKHQPVIIYLIGFLLIAFGLKLTGIIDIASIEILGFMMIIFGISYVFVSFGQNRKGILFTSTVIFLTGVLIYIINNFEFFDTFSLLYPSFLFIMGISFLMIYIDGGTGIMYLIMSLLFLIMGGVITVINGDFKGSSFWTSLANVSSVYWPVIFVVAVVYLLILRGERRNR